ncbi:MAG TPA: hypothetical protein PLB92_00010 [Rhodoglobus sp.]|nr:hypothetical protein [Rhodoglobus sp.]
MDYTRPDGLVARTDTSTPCRCERPDCEWTEQDDIQRDLHLSPLHLVQEEDFKADPGKLLMLRFEDKVYQYQLIVDEHGTIVDQKKCPVPRG